MADMKTTFSPSPAVGALTPQSPRNEGPAKPGAGPSFSETLSSLNSTRAGAASGANAPQAIKFSNHAVDRMRQRGITYSPDQMDRINRAVEKAATKGAKETLLLTDESAMIVSVNNRTVVTVMDKAALKENVFTNIDSTVVI